MVLIPKEVLPPGDYHTEDGVLRVTPQRIRHWVEQFKRMKEAGFSVPCPWEHQNGVKPVDQASRLANRVKHNAGWVARFSINDDGMLMALVEVPADLAGDLRDRVRYVSPEIKDEFVDGDGHTWHDVITHLALTTRPVNHRQKPFGAPVRMSYQGTVRLSQAVRLGCKMKKKMAQDDAWEHKEGKNETSTEDQHDKVRMAEEEPGGEGGGGGTDYLAECKDLLSSKFGIDLHESTDESTFLRDLCMALTAAQGNGASETETETPPEEMPTEETPTQEQPGGGSMMLSLEKRVQVLEDQNKSLLDQNATLVSERELARLGRYEKEGRCSPAQAKSLRDKLGKHRLSLTRAGDANAVAVATALECMAAVPAGTFWSAEQKAARLSHTHEEKPRTPLGAEPISTERAGQIAEEQLKAAGYN
jgi:hypothetical protein